jgi:hypothetical protein
MAVTVSLKFFIWDAEVLRMGGERSVWSVVLVGSLVALTLVSGVFSAVAVDPKPPAANNGNVRAAGDAFSDVADTTTSTWPFVPAPPTTATPPVTQPPVPTTRRPPTTVTTRPPVVRPSTTTTTTAPLVPRNKRSDYGAILPAELVQLAYTPGQTSWAGVSNGVSYKVAIDKPARAGAPVEFDVELSSAVHPCCQMYLLYGDGYFGGQFNCEALPMASGPLRFHASHVYNTDGLWLFWVEAMTGCETPPVISILMATIEVHPGPATAQGPSLPVLDIERTQTGHDADLSWAAVAGRVSDADGWIKSVSIDWGDGSPPLTLTGDSPCLPTLAGWPGPDSMWIDRAVHQYRSPDTYVIVATGVSTGCDGTSNPQTGTDRIVWPVPASG